MFWLYSNFPMLWLYSNFPMFWLYWNFPMFWLYTNFPMFWLHLYLYRHHKYWLCIENWYKTNDIWKLRCSWLPQPRTTHPPPPRIGAGCRSRECPVMPCMRATRRPARTGKYYSSYKRPSYKTLVCQLVFGKLALENSWIYQIWVLFRL
jgi:hypothetical protein